MPRDVGWEWKATGWWVRPRDSREVMSTLGSIGVFSTGQQFAWRGMSSADHSIKSSLHRAVGGSEATVRAEELLMLSDARKWGLGNYATGQVDDLQLLSDLQHFGVATRLIDVTHNPMTALWFACQESSTQNIAKSGLLLALNVTSWPRLSTVSSSMTYARVADPVGSRLHLQLQTGLPFVVESAVPNARLRAQEGFFVAGQVPNVVPSPNGIFKVTPFKSIDVRWKPGDPVDLQRKLTVSRTVGAPGTLPFVAIIIDAALKSKLRKYLAGTYNRSAGVLFPDYEGFRQYGDHVRRLP